MGHADLVEEVEGGCVEEGQVQNVDVEVVEEDREDDPDQVMLMTTAKTMMAKKLSMSKVDARRCHEEGRDLVVERCEEEVVQKMMMMCRCGGVESLTMDSRGPRGIRALLPC